MKYLILLVSISIVMITCAKEEFVPEQGTSNGAEIAIPAAETMVINDTMSTLLELSANALTFTEDQMLMDSVKIGSILMAGPSENAPYGYLRRVTGISTQNGQIIYNTERATLEDAFEELQFEYEKVLDFNSYTRDLCKSYSGNTMNSGTPIDLSWNSEFCLDAKFKTEINLSGTSRLGFESFTLTYTDEFIYNFANINPELDPIVLLDKEGATTVALIGGVFPLVITPIGRISLVFENIDIQGNVKVPISLELKGNDLIVTYSDANGVGNQVPTNALTFSSKTGFSDIEIDLTGELKLGLDMDFLFQFYENDNAEMGLNWKHRIDTEFSMGSNPSCFYYYNFGADYRMELDFTYKFGETTRNLPIFSTPYVRPLWHDGKCVDCPVDQNGFRGQATLGQCFDNGTPEDFTDDNSEFLFTGIKEPFNISDTYKITIDGIQQAGTFPYTIEQSFNLSAGYHSIMIQDSDREGCIWIEELNIDCQSGELEELGDNGQPPTMICNQRITDDRDGEIYCYLDVVNSAGISRRWLRRNLRYADDNTSNIGFYVDDDSANWRKGKLYTWDEVKDDNLCPSGYHIATIDEWNHLFATVQEKNGLSSNTGTGPYLKSPKYWPQGGKGNGEELYSRYFELLPNGYYTRYEDEFLESSKSANIWTLSPYVDYNGNTSELSIISMNSDEDSDYIFELPVVKEAFALGCRCVEDY